MSAEETPATPGGPLSGNLSLVLRMRVACCRVARLITRDSLGGRLARRLLPATALVPILLGFTMLAWRSRSGLHGTHGGAALLMTAAALAFAALTVFTALSLDRADRERSLVDARQMRAARALEQAIATRDEFLSVASHELRTPLTALKLQLDSLQTVMSRSPVRPDPRLEKKVSTALRQTDRMSHLIDGLLDVSRIAMGRFRLQLEDFDLVTVVRDVLRRFQDEADGAHTPVDVIAPASILGRWDRPRLEQVLANLLGNALKYGVGKPVHLRVEATADTVSVVVRDQGIGIAQQDLLRIFQRFERAVPLRHYGGLGLGLYITHQIAQAHGGAISVTSTPGDGATFVVALPRWTPLLDGEAVQAETDRLSSRGELSPHSDDEAANEAAGDARGSGVRVTVGRSSPAAGPSPSPTAAAPRRGAR